MKSIFENKQVKDESTLPFHKWKEEKFYYCAKNRSILGNHIIVNKFDFIIKKLNLVHVSHPFLFLAVRSNVEVRSLVTGSLIEILETSVCCFKLEQLY